MRHIINKLVMSTENHKTTQIKSCKNRNIHENRTHTRNITKCLPRLYHKRSHLISIKLDIRAVHISATNKTKKTKTANDKIQLLERCLCYVGVQTTSLE